VIEGSYREELTPATLDPARGLTRRFAAYERAGTYTVTLSQPGYLPWRASLVHVTRDECHVNTVTVTALLEVAP